jgi:hypothetical protein
MKNIPKIFDHKEKELISLSKGYHIIIEKGEVLYSPKHVSSIIKKIILKSNEMKIEIYTDGSFFYNPLILSYGFIVYKDKNKIYEESGIINETIIVKIFFWINKRYE